MRYTIINKSISADTDVFDTVINEDGSQEIIPTSKYFVAITLTIEDTESMANPFNQSLTITSDNAETGFEVNAARNTAINNYLDSINN